MTVNELKGHTSIAVAQTMWGMMAPAGKLVLTSGIISPLVLTDCRIFGAAILFWIASFFTKKEEVTRKDLMLLFFAALFGIVFNQGSYVLGLSMTSPINASILTTSSPILTMIIAALYLREPITGKKLMGIFIGATGALILILGGSGASLNQLGHSWGDLICVMAQLSFACYLVFFKGLITRYSSITLMKWMFTYSSICMLPFSYKDFIQSDWASLDWKLAGCIFIVVFCGTFISYLLVPFSQKILRPTVVSMYNYVQPIVASSVAILWGLDHFNLMKLFAVLLVFIGVFFVTQSKAKLQENKVNS